MKTNREMVQFHRRFSGRPTRGKTYEFCRGYLIRAVPAGKKFHAQIICPNVWNEMTFGGWDSESDAIEWARDEVETVLTPIPPLMREGIKHQYADFIALAALSAGKAGEK